jgi:hypothetical protein
MDVISLPEHYTPSSDRRIATWLGAFAVLAAAAVAIRRGSASTRG